MWRNLSCGEISEICFVAIYALFVWRKIEPKIVLVERKKTNIRYAYYEPSPVLIRALPPDVFSF